MSGIAESIFNRIGIGKENAVPRPTNRSDDRKLWELISVWNGDSEHDPIINVGNGYYKPRPWVPAEALEFKEYMAKESARMEFIRTKLVPMKRSFERMAQDGAELTGGYEQLILPLE